MKALTFFEEKGDTTAFHSLFNDPTGSLHAVGRATLTKIMCAQVDRNFTEAEKILAADPQPEFDAGQRRFLSRDFLLGSIKYSAGDKTGAKTAYANARPLQMAYVQKWPDDPNPLMILAVTDAALGAKENAVDEARNAMKMKPKSEDAIEMPLLAVDLARVYLLCGENELAMKQLESLEQVPQALTFGDLAKLPDWDSLRGDPRFQKLLATLRPIPITNHLPAQN
jgi:hypothetical protein